MPKSRARSTPQSRSDIIDIKGALEEADRVVSKLGLPLSAKASLELRLPWYPTLLKLRPKYTRVVLARIMTELSGMPWTFADIKIALERVSQGRM